MAYDIEALRKKYQVTPTATSSYDVSTLRQKYLPSETPEVKAQMPILTNPQGGFDTALKDVVVGAGKGLLGGMQSFGKLALEVGSLGKIDSDKLGIDEEKLKAKSRGEQVGKVLEFGAELGTGFVAAKVPQVITKAKQAYTVSREAKAGEKVLEMISPKPTVGQARLAQSQGRLVEGKPATFFKRGTEGSILPTKKTLSARDLIIEKIPNAAKMQPTELYKAVDTEITTTAQKLKPQMQATPIKPETIQAINDDWTKLKKLQVEVADATEEANVIKLQQQFEARLMKSGNTSYDDLWETRKAYDDSIPDNVKRANEISSESLQNKKEIWLQNRGILNKAMDDVAGNAFKEMSNLYEARTGLMSKAKVDKAQMSKLREFAKKHPEITTLLKGIIGIKAFESLTGVDLPL